MERLHGGKGRIGQGRSEGVERGLAGGDSQGSPLPILWDEEEEIKQEINMLKKYSHHRNAIPTTGPSSKSPRRPALGEEGAPGLPDVHLFSCL